MPNYDYKCRVCGTTWLKFHSVKEDATSLGLVCPECNSEDIYRYFGDMKTVPIHFKGTGFTLNDHALDRIGFPKHYREIPDVKNKLKDM